MRNQTKRIVRFVSVFVLLVGLAFYVYTQTSGFLEGPALTVIEPENGAAVASPLVAISGITERVSHITLNGKNIFIDTEGVFEESLLLAPGYNILDVVVRDRFGRAKQEVIELVYTPRPL